MGADQLFQTIFYFTLLYYKCHRVFFPLVLTEVAFYGPMTLGGPLAAFIGALTLL
jgi:hypothetical protein